MPSTQKPSIYDDENIFGFGAQPSTYLHMKLEKRSHTNIQVEHQYQQNGRLIIPNHLK